MDLKTLVPMMIYDDRCYLCTRLASIVRFISKGLLVVGHYSDLGIKIRTRIFPKAYDPTEMFWFVDNKMAYGGRAALRPLILSIILHRDKPSVVSYENETSCDTTCKTPKAVFLRSASLLKKSKKISLNL